MNRMIPKMKVMKVPKAKVLKVPKLTANKAKAMPTAVLGQALSPKGQKYNPSI